MLKRFPNDSRLLLQKLDNLPGDDNRDERLALLEEVCRRPDCDPIFFIRYAQEFGEDARAEEGGGREGEVVV